MGKKSLIKSTTPKKETPGTAKGKKAKGPASPAQPQNAAKSAEPAAAEKAPAAPRKPVTLRELLQERFSHNWPQPLFAPVQVAQTITDPPPYFESQDAGELKRLRAVLYEKFSMSAAIEAARRAEKAAAEKAAAEKAAAEKAAAEKAAAEKAAAEKAAAEKAAAEKAAAEVAAAEKAAKAAREQAAAQRAADLLNPPPPRAQAPQPPRGDLAKRFGIAAAGLVGALLLIAMMITSGVNHTRFYLKPSADGVEIWRGRFATKGAALFLSLKGVKAPAPIKPVYSKEEVYPIAFNYYLRQADALLEKPGIPDFDGIRALVNTALPYATSKTVREAAEARLSGIDALLLIYKADVAQSRATIADLKAAREMLDKAQRLDKGGHFADAIRPRLEALAKALAEAKAGSTIAKTAPKATEPAPQESKAAATPAAPAAVHGEVKAAAQAPQASQPKEAKPAADSHGEAKPTAHTAVKAEPHAAEKPAGH